MSFDYFLWMGALYIHALVVYCLIRFFGIVMSSYGRTPYHEKVLEIATIEAYLIALLGATDSMSRFLDWSMFETWFFLSVVTTMLVSTVIGHLAKMRNLRQPINQERNQS